MYLILSLPIFIINTIFVYKATKRLLEARPFSNYPYRIDTILVMMMYSLPSSFGTVLLDFFSFIKTPNYFVCLVFAISSRLNTLGSVLFIGILVYLVSIFSNRIKPKTIEKFGSTFLTLTTGLSILALVYRVISNSEIHIFSNKLGSVDSCFFKSNLIDDFLWKLAHINITLSFSVSICLFVYENYFLKSKDEPKRNNIIASYFLMGLNQLGVYTLVFLTKGPSPIIRKRFLKNVIFDVTRLRTCFLSLIVLYFEGKARINLDSYPIKRILQTEELLGKLKTYAKRVRNKKMGSLAMRWEEVQREKNKQDKCLKENAIIKELELEGFYGFVLADEFLEYVVKIQRAGKSELDIS